MNKIHKTLKTDITLCFIKISDKKDTRTMQSADIILLLYIYFFSYTNI